MAALQSDSRWAGLDETTPLLKNLEADATYFTENVNIPDLENYRFSFQKFFAFVGPGFLMSIALLDPGNIESDLQSGAVAKYKLLWVLLVSTLLALIMQSLAIRLGTATGRHLAEVCYDNYPFCPRIVLWLTVEIAIIGSDMQEVIGTAIAFTLVSLGRLPLWAGVLITIVDTFIFLLIDRFGIRKLEAFFIFLISIMVVTFGYEYIKMKPNQAEVLEGLFLPYCKDCSQEAALQAISIIGATVMPHNLYLHSALVKTRNINRDETKAVKEANLYFAIESTIALVISLIVNVFVASVFGTGLYQQTNMDVRNICLSNNQPESALKFDNNSNPVDINIYKAGIYLGCEFGNVAMYIWAIGIYAAGQSSTMTGTYSGQFVMEGFLHLRWKRWQRVLLTRSLAILPTLFVALLKDVNDLSGMNDALNSLQSILLPFALIPILTVTSNTRVMKNFKNGRFLTFIASLLSLGLIAANIYFLIDYVRKKLEGLVSLAVVIAIFTIVMIIYHLILLYFAFYGLILNGTCKILNSKIFPECLAVKNVDFPATFICNTEDVY